MGGIGMALLKCPDCGKMVSERASACPDCGCPREFFEAPNEEKNINENESATKPVQKKEIEEITFKIAEFTLSYPKGSESYAALFGYYLQAADLSYGEMCKLYDSAKGIGKALEIIPDKAIELIYGMIDQGTKFLYQSGVNITPEQFIEKYRNKYSIDYTRFYNLTLEKYSEIMNMKQELEAYRNAEKASRGRWQGGGFGVKGAIKGAVTASALNLGSDFLHSFGDSAKARKDNQAVQSELGALYRESRGQLCHSVKTCIMNVFEAMCEELDKIHFFEVRLPINKVDAETLYQSAKKYETDPNEFRKKMITCIHTYPGDKRYYECFREEWLNGDSQIQEFLEFWQLTYLLEDVFREREEKDRFTTYIVGKGIEDFDFNNKTAENAVVLLQMLQDWKANLPQNGEWANKIEEYESFLLFNDEIIKEEIIVDYLPNDLKVHEFIQICNDNQLIFGGDGLGEFWYQGASCRVEPTRQVLMELLDGQDYLCLYCDSSLLQNGGKGLAITSRYVVDLKSKLRIRCENIKEVSVEEKRGQYSLEFSDGVNSILFRNFSIEDCMYSAYYLRQVIVSVLVRYCNNKLLKNAVIQNVSDRIEINAEGAESYSSHLEISDSNQEVVKKTAKRIEEIINRYAEENGIEDTSALLKAFLIKHHVLEETATIFCPYCGNKILRTAKFCNFCGKENSYGKGK